MKIPSATGLVFASLALSGSTLAAPTGSPIPGSPNPGLNSPRHELDSPRFANSPDVNSPRASTQAFFLGRRSRHKRNSSTNVQGPSAGLGLVAPVENPAATPMQRSMAQLSIRDDSTVSAQGLGLVDQPTADKLKDTIHGIGSQLAGLPAGAALEGIVDAVGDTVAGLIGPNPPPTRRTTPHWMRRQTPNTDPNGTPPVGDGSVSAEGLGLVSPATGQQIAGALHGLGDTVSATIPVVGPVVGGLVGTIGDLLGGLIARDGASVNAGAGATIHDPHHARSANPPDVQGLPSQALGTASNLLPQGFAAASQFPGEVIGPDGRIYQAIGQLPPGVQFAPQAALGAAGAVQQTAGGVAGTVQQTAGGVVGAAASNLPVSAPNPGSAPDPMQLPGQVAGMLPTSAVTGLAGGLLGGVTGAAGGVVGTAAGIAGGLPVVGGTAAGLAGTATGIAGGLTGIPSGLLGGAAGLLPFGGLGSIIGYTSNGLPIFGAASAESSNGQAPNPLSMVGGVAQTASGLLGSTPLGGVAGTVTQTITGAASNSPVSGVAQTVANTLNNSPLGSVVGTVGQTVGNSPAGAVVGTVAGAAAGVAGNVPVVGPTLSGLLSSLPGVGGSSGGFGILSTPDKVTGVASGVSSMLPTSTALAMATGSALPVSPPTAAAASADAEDDESEVDDEEFGDDSDDEDPADDAKDATDDNDDPSYSTIGNSASTSYYPSASATADPSASATTSAMETPTASVPSS